MQMRHPFIRKPFTLPNNVQRPLSDVGNLMQTTRPYKQELLATHQQQQLLSTPSLNPVERLCHPPNTALGLAHLPLIGYTPCLENLLLLNPAYLAVMWILVWRIMRKNKAEGFETAPILSTQGGGNWKVISNSLKGLDSVAIASIGVCLLSTLLPCHTLLVGWSTGTLSPVAVASNAIVCLTWIMVALAGSKDFKVHGRWTYRFVTALLFVVGAFRFRQTILFSSFKSPVILALHWMQLIGQGFLVLVAALGWAPRLERKQRAKLKTFPTGDTQVCPERDSNFISRILWNWLSPLVRKGEKVPLAQQDVWQVHPLDGAEVNHARFVSMWKQEVQMDQPSLLRALYRSFGAQYVKAGLWRATTDALSFMGPMLLGKLIAVVSGDAPTMQGYTIAFALFVAQFLLQTADNFFLKNVFSVGVHMQGALMAEIYQKSLRLSSRARATMSTGQIINYMTVDAEQLQAAVNTGHVVWAAPLRILIAVGFLYRILGVASFAGVATLFALFPLQLKAAEYMGHYTIESRKHSDARVHLINEILAGIRVIKSLVWEKAFLQRVAGERDQELKWFRKVAILRALMNLFVGISPVLLAFVSFAVYSLLGGTLTPSITFPSLGLFAIIQLPLWFIPPAFQSLLQAKVAYSRLKSFFLAEELQQQPAIERHDGVTVEVINAEFTWRADQGQPCLKNINFAIPKGALVCIVGATGSGKSSLLQALAGEMERISGHMSIQGTVGYVSQKPWLCRGTVHENIVFGTPVDPVRYKQAVDAAQLTEDIEDFAGQDAYDLGEGGINLSGGQRQRVSLARALYRQADVYLLDDPLSALDAKVGRAVFEQAINGMLANTTRLWVCNQLQFLQKADKIIVMHDGEISGLGTYEELLISNSYFAELMQEYSSDAFIAGHVNNAALVAATETSASDSDQESKASEASSKTATVKGQLVQEEKMVTGTTLSGRNVMFYLSALGGGLVAIQMVALYILIEVCRIGNQLWLTWWSGSRWKLPLATWLGVYAAWGIGQTSFALINAIFLTDRGVLAARRLHEKMLGCLMKAPTGFFDATPRGRIVNRFTKDQATIDGYLMFSVSAFLSACALLGSTTLLVVVNTPYTCIVLVPLAAFFARTQRRFQRTARELKRMDAITRSPIYSHFGETLNGMATIRSFGAQSHMSHLNYRDVMNNQRFTYVNLSVNRWLAVRLELIGSAVMFCAGCFAVQQRAQLGAAALGLILSQTSNITALLGFLIRMTAELENAFNSVERVYEYTALPQEHDLAVVNLPKSWPSQGAVTFDHVFMRYREDMPYCLRNLNFYIQPKEKIGVVGRTGAGKSSLSVALLRFCEVSSGSIEVDGVNIGHIPVEQLRKSITLVPQDAALFAATIRYNLDPLGEKNDAEIWVALAQANLKEYVSELPDQLDAQIREGGAPFSVGSRQLLCLARALLHRSKVVVIDEATANIDTLTDDLIHRTIATQFKDCTVITIAHRLSAIMDSDRVMVMQDGEVIQFDSPEALLQIPRDEPSVFRDLVDQTNLVGASQ